MDFTQSTGIGMADARGSLAMGARMLGGVAMDTAYDVACLAPDGTERWRERCHNRVVTAGLNKLLDAAFKTGLAAPAWFVGICAPSVADAATTASSTTLTSATAGFAAGDAGRSILVRGAGAAGADLVTTIASVTNATTIVLAAAAQASLSTVAIIFEARAADTTSAHGPWVESTNYSNATRPAFTPGTIAGGSLDNSAAVAAFSVNVNNSLIGGCFLADSNTKGGTTGTLYGMAVFSGGFRQAQSGDTLNVTATLTAAST